MDMELILNCEQERIDECEKKQERREGRAESKEEKEEKNMREEGRKKIRTVEGNKKGGKEERK